ncbi:hypothetical protein TIFTF001_020565 [Ficus carica]|uniref:Uncharacterized protein n=1 Tax=Ficus carica TaxID=3494 RepID=A0AA88DB72_FICCA|nr:hypothetical protein TIFTF001_020565 [Ficus carica]
MMASREFDTVSNDEHPLASTTFMDNGSPESKRVCQDLRREAKFPVLNISGRKSCQGAYCRWCLGQTYSGHSKKTIPERFSIDDCNSLIPDSSSVRCLKCSIGSEISGKYSNFEQSSR